jgi:hypothetical protein
MIEMAFRCKGHWSFPADGEALIRNAVIERVSAMTESANEKTKNVNKLTESAQEPIE